MRTRHILSLFLLATAGSASLAADADSAAKPPAAEGSEPRAYVGDGLRLSAGYDSKTKLRGEYFQVFQEDSAKALIGEGWISGSAGGLKLNYHWLPSAGQPADNVRKLFAAIDQNSESDRKLTLGGGVEYKSWFWGASLSHALTARRLVSTRTDSVIDVVGGVDNGRMYSQATTTATTTRLFERAYDYGIGVTAGRFYEPALLRMYTRLDHEWGSGSARQATLAGGVEKFFADSPMSVAVNAEVYRKSGELEPKQNDRRINLLFRYELGGKSFRPARESRMVQAVPATAAIDAAPSTGADAPGSNAGAGANATGAGTLQEAPRKTEMRMVKTTASMSADAFFLFDSVKMTPTALTALEGVVARLKASGHTGNLHLSGHTCNIGPAAYNQKLSEKRASAVKDYLAKHGVSADSVIVEGKGEADPRYSNKTKESRAKNRRVDMEFVSYVEKAEEITLPADSAPAAKPDAADNSTAGKTAAANQDSQAVEWKREYIESEPVWLRRALHHTVPHKQSVDVYRQEQKSVVVTTGPRNYTNRPPVAANDSFQVVPNSSNNLLDVLANDSDPDADPLRITAVQNPAHGTATINGNRLVYTPASGYAGVDSFTYTISDDKGLTASATVTVTTGVVNRAPLAAADAFTVTTNSSNNLLDVLSNDSDPDGDALRILSVQTPAHGTASISGNRVAYAPAAGYIGSDSFSYTVTDDKGLTATAIVSITVSAANAMPLAKDDEAWAIWGQPARINVLANDSDPDGDALTITSIGPVAHGVATISGGSIIYTSRPDFSGREVFTYTISDGRGGTASATVRVSVVDP